MKVVRHILVIILMLLFLPFLCGAIIKLPDLSDIKGHWAEEYIVESLERGYVMGYDDERFRPSQPVTRAEFIKMTVLAFSITKNQDAELQKPHLFEDTADHWAEAYISAAYNAGLIQGVQESRFVPDKELSRQDAILILSRVEHYLGQTLTETQHNIPFLDREYIRSECRGAVSHFYNAGIICGKIGNLFDPIGDMTRAEAVKCIIFTIRGLETPINSVKE